LHLWVTMGPAHLISFFVIASTLLCTPIKASIECTQYSNADSVLTELFHQCAMESSCIANAASDLLESESCNCQQIGGALAIAYKTKDLLDAIRLDYDCAGQVNRYWANRGAYAFNEEQYDEALRSYFVIASDSTFKSAILSNIGASYYSKNDLTSALGCFIEAWETQEGLNKSSIALLNNITAIAMDQGDFGEAANWNTLSQSTIREFEDRLSDDDFEYYSAIAHGNEWLIRLSQRDTVFAEENWSNFEWGAAFGDDVFWFRSMTLASEIISDPAFYESEIRSLLSVSNNLADSKENIQAFGQYSHLLVSKDDNQDLLTMLRDWQLIGQLSKQAFKWDDQKNPAPQSLTTGSLSTRQLAYWFLALGLIAINFSFLSKRKKGRSIEKESTMNSFETLRSWIRGNSISKASLLESVREISRYSDGSVEGLIEKLGIEVNHNERLVMDSIAKGNDPKELSRLTGWTPGHVYNIRSNLRKKLGVPSNVQLDDWLLTKLNNKKP